MNNFKLLLVEDEENFGSVLKNYLELYDFEIDWAKDGNVGYNLALTKDYHLYIFDVMMPYKDGFTLAAEVKKQRPQIPFIFLTAKSMKEDQLRGFKLGADDFITKPFDSELLLYKIKAILGRTTSVQEEKLKETIFELGNFTFDSSKRNLIFDKQKTRLSPKESKLLALLCQHKNNILSREKALLEIWGNNDYFTKRSMDVYIAKLRKHLAPDPTLKIENIHGEGYTLLEA